MAEATIHSYIDRRKVQFNKTYIFKIFWYGKYTRHNKPHIHFHYHEFHRPTIHFQAPRKSSNRENTII